MVASGIKNHPKRSFRKKHQQFGKINSRWSYHNKSTIPRRHPQGVIPKASSHMWSTPADVCCPSPVPRPQRRPRRRGWRRSPRLSSWLRDGMMVTYADAWWVDFPMKNWRIFPQLCWYVYQRVWPFITGWWLSPTPLKNDGASSSVGMMKFPMEIQKSHVPNHQPDGNVNPGLINPKRLGCLIGRIPGYLP